jgi:hypothetical protein
MLRKHKGPEIKHADAHQDEELHVTRTTPQGTQESGVEKGYEKRDIKIRSIIKWFTGLAIYTAVTIVAMIALVAILHWQDREQKTRVSSPLFGKELPRRTPELLPNPQQKVYAYPWDHYRNFVSQESVKMKQSGLEDEFGRPALPTTAMSAVTSAPSRSAIKWRDETRPSEPSGGREVDKVVLTTDTRSD